jgi:uncharacterized membrane protein YidH (DUF202 family)
MQKYYMKSAIVFLIYLSSWTCRAGFEDTVGGVNNVLYGIAAGIAALLIAIHAVRWKTAESPNDREEAKKGIFNVILGIVVIIVAATLVALLFRKP